MSELNQKTVAFRLPCGLPAVSATFLEDGSFAAVSGQDPAVYLFSPNGSFCKACETVRPYAGLHRSTTDPTDGTYLATSHCTQNNRVYLLNCRFEEFGSIDLRPTEGDCADVGELMDAFPYTELSEEGCLRARIHAAFRQSVRVFDYGGKQQSVILPPDGEELLLHYAISGAAQALHYQRDQTEFINLAEAGDVYLGIVPNELRMRGFLPIGLHDFYGLFGYRYFYNYLVPIYQCGRFLLPSVLDTERILQNIRPCS